MPATICCSRCRSQNVMFSRKRNLHICEDCGHDFVVEKPFEPQRIFLSYGHDSNEELVRRIKADLEKRGHDVWFDKSEVKDRGITHGDDWRRAITDGILKSNRVLSFLSKHSTRDPGVCRDEIAIAIGVKGGNIQTILVESEQEVQPPVNIGHIQWLDMHDWKERRERSLGVPPEHQDSWEQWYQAKLAEIVRVVESDESRRFAGEIETLNGHLKPIKSEARICQLLSKGFYGRQWLFKAVENWRLGIPPSGSPASLSLATCHSSLATSPSRLFWIMGAPGVGKSAFAAQLTHTRGDTVIAAQFCEWDKPDHRNAPRVVRSLAFQLATRLPDYRKLLLTLPEIAELDRKDAAELFDYLLANPLRSVINGGRQRYLIVIDALDEAGEAGRNPLVEMLARNAQRLPDWLGLVVTSRPEFDVKTPLQALNPFPLDTASESNRADIRDYLLSELASPLQNRPDADPLVEQILEKSEGVFLYAERFCDDVQRGHLSLDRPEQFPQGLGGIFLQYFKRQFCDQENYEKTIEPPLGAILAARQPLPVEILQKLFGWRETELRKWLRKLGSMFPVATDKGHEVIKLYHKSLADWLVDEAKAGPFFASVLEGHRMLAQFCLCSWQHDNDYARSEVVFHLVRADRFEDVSAVLFDSAFRDEFRRPHRIAYASTKVHGLGGIDKTDRAIRLHKFWNDFELAERTFCSRLGLAGAAGYLCECAEDRLTYAGQPERWSVEECHRHISNWKELTCDAQLASQFWMRDGVSERACALFGSKTLCELNLDRSEIRHAIQTLSSYATGADSMAMLTFANETLWPALASAQNSPEDYFSGCDCARTNRTHASLVVESLSAANAALGLEPLRMVRSLWSACIDDAVCSCYSDPVGACSFAVHDAKEALLPKMYSLIRLIVSMDSKSLRAVEKL